MQKYILVLFILVSVVSCGDETAKFQEKIRQKDYAAVKAMMGKNPRLTVMTNHEGQNSLHIAVLTGDAEMVRLLVKSTNHPVKLRDAQGMTAMHYAARNPRADLMRILMESGGDINSAATGNGWTPLHYACSNGNLELTAFLVTNRAYLEAADKSRRTPSFYAVEQGNLDVLRYLTAYNANVVGAKDNEGRTLLHIACLTPGRRSAEVVEFLMSEGAILELPDKNEKTPYYYANKAGNKAVVELFKSKGIEE